MLLQEWNIFEEELFLQVLSAGRDDDAFAAADYREQVSQGFSGAGSGLDDQMPALGQRFFDGFSHLQLPAAKLILRMGLAEQASGGKELLQRRRLGCRRRRACPGLRRGGHGQAVLIKAAT